RVRDRHRSRTALRLSRIARTVRAGRPTILVARFTRCWVLDATAKPWWKYPTPPSAGTFEFLHSFDENRAHPEDHSDRCRELLTQRASLRTRTPELAQPRQCDAN